MNKFKKCMDGIICRKSIIPTFLVTAVIGIIYFFACIKMKAGFGKSIIVPMYIFLSQCGVCFACGENRNALPVFVIQLGAVVVFAFMYFITGGGTAGAVMWLFFGMLCVRTALRGKMCTVLCAISAAVALVCVCIEMGSPALAAVNVDKNYAYMNVLFSMTAFFAVLKNVRGYEEKSNGENSKISDEAVKLAHERREKVERLTLQIMITLANTIDAKDKYTNGHSIRVAEYAREIARRVGKSEQEQEAIYFTGLLHDIGKIGIPNAIINKSSGLTDEEYEIVKTHPKIGADILKNMTEIPGIADGAHWHHELYNGQGYPDGLKDGQIPETARIIGVADAYDAMASKRSYRDTLPQHTVRKEIEKGIGKQFDPVFAKIMLEMIDEDTDYIMCER